MDAGSVNALLPAERGNLPALRTGRGGGSGSRGAGPGSPGTLVFLGYGYGAGPAQGLYDEAGRRTRSWRTPGSLLDVYA
jgi:hypothetical protein